MPKRCKPLEQVINELKEMEYRYACAVKEGINHVVGSTAKRKHVWDSRRSIMAEKFRILADNEVAGLSDTRSIGKKLRKV